MIIVMMLSISITIIDMILFFIINNALNFINFIVYTVFEMKEIMVIFINFL